MYLVRSSCWLVLVFVGFVDVKATLGSSGAALVSATRPKLAITFNTPTQEEWTLTYTGCSLEVTTNPSVTNLTATGGILECAEYTLYKSSLHWNVHKNRNILAVYNLHYNRKKYGTFKNALKNGGVFSLVIPIEANGCVDNPAFCHFEEIFQKIKKSGDRVTLRSIYAYKWYANFPVLSPYASLNGSYCDEKSDERYRRVLIIKLPTEPWSNFISKRQFEKTFGSLAFNPPPKIEEDSWEKIQKGVVVRFE